MSLVSDKPKTLSNANIFLQTVSTSSRGHPDDLEPWHRSINRMNGHNPIQYQAPIETQKKEKPKWSLGGLFRRRKKEDTDSSSGCEEEGNKKGFLSRKSSNRSKRQNPARIATGFDHIVVPQIQSDNSGSKESLVSGSGSLERHKRRKERVKARAEALRDRLKNASSSDEDETSPGSSLSKFRSDDSLHGSLPRRSRRFRKTLKDDDNQQGPYLRNSYSSSSIAPKIHDNGIMHVQLPLGLHNNLTKAPPPPPPRDHTKKYFNLNHDASRPLSYAFDDSRTKDRCNSEDHISLNDKYRTSYMPDRPASVTAEVIRPQVKRFITRHPSDNDVTQGQYKYFADQSPRSRKPILATPFDAVTKMYRPPPLNTCKSVRSASDFWKMKDKEESARRMKESTNFTVRDVPLKEVKKREPPVPPQRKYTPNRTSSGSSNGEAYDVRPKSANLEDALSELEAIYKSLKLSDEDLLDKAEPVRTDDMAYRRLHPKDLKHHQDLSPQISYLSSSPLTAKTFDYNIHNNNKEPDVILDDVVYRNVRQAKQSLRIKEPQPPFGIPLGPVIPGANSDYLHAAPKTTFRPRFIPKKNHDIIGDDLAYRNLRKDQNRTSALPPVKPLNDDMHFMFNNNEASIKKKRAVRSMSANVYSLLHQHMQSLIDDDEEDFGKSLKSTNTLPSAKFLSRSPTASTETLISSQNDLRSKREDEFLTALARRAKAATEKIDQELKELRNDISKANANSPSVSDILRELEQVSESAQKCQDSIKNSINQQEHEPTTYNLVPAIDSGHTTEESDAELQQVDIIDNAAPLVYTSVATILEQETGSKFQDLSEKCQMQLSNLDNDYDNVPSTVLELGRLVGNNSPKQYTAPIGSEMKRKKSLMQSNDINANETILSISEILNAEEDKSKSSTPDYANIPPKTKPPSDEESSEYNSAEELAMIFGKDETKSKSSSPCKSPLLDKDSRTKDQGSGSSSGGTKANHWFYDPRHVLIVCAYGLALLQQFSGLDLFVLLSLLLAVLSVIAMLLI